MTDDPNYPAPTEAAPAEAPVDGAAAQAETVKQEGEEFLAQLEKEAESKKREYMSARVPPSLREAFEEKYPAPEPDQPTADQESGANQQNEPQPQPA